MPVPELFLFGYPRIEIDGRAVDFHRRRALALLACLAVGRAGQPRDGLMALLWPTFAPEDARNNLRRELSYLRSLLGEGLVADRNVVALDPAAVSVDLWAFTASLTVAHAHIPQHPGALCATCARSLLAAVDRYTADFLDGFSLPDSPAFDEWQTLERERLRRSAIGALEQAAEWHEGRGEHEAAAALAERMLSLEPFHEPAYRVQMRVLAAGGQRVAALRRYEQLRQQLARDMGVEPEPQTTSLLESIQRGQQAIHDKQSSATVPKSYLPIFPTPFVGRAAAVSALAGLLNKPDTRLLTLIGPGGMGKTRLAVAAAEALARGEHRFDHGIRFVSLVGVAAAEAIPDVMAEALAFPFQRDDTSPPARQLLDYLSGRRLLLVLDNAEHLLPGGAEFPAQITREAPGVTLLITSRLRLNVSGEQLFPLAGMDTPPESESGEAQPATVYSAVALFLQAARRVRPDFRLTPENRRDVAAICRRLGGMPLAIELAAAWLEALSIQDIAAEIDRGLDILATDLSDVPDRQRSIRAVFDTSFRLLTEAERVTLARLAVFRDGFSLEAAEAVAGTEGQRGAFLQILLGLAHKSWLSRVERNRYQMHDLLRRYAEEQLGESRDAAREAHARYFAGFLESLWPQLISDRQIAACDAIAADLGNVLIAWEWFIERGEMGPVAQNLLLPMSYFTSIRQWATGFSSLLDRTTAATPPTENDVSYLTVRIARALIQPIAWMVDRELRAIWDSVTALPDPAIEALGVWYIWLSSEYGEQVDRAAGLRVLRRLLARGEHGRPWLSAQTQRALGTLILADWREPAELEEGCDLLGRAAANFEQSGDAFALAFVLVTLARESVGIMRPEDRLALIDRARILLESIGRSIDSWDYTFHRHGLHIRLGRPERIFVEVAEQVAIARERGDRLATARALAWESSYALRYDTIDHAMRARNEALAAARDSNSPYDTAWSLWNMGEIYRVMGDPAEARRYISRAEAMFQELHNAMGLSYVEFGFGSVALAAGDPAEARERLTRFLEQSRLQPANRWNEINALIWLARADIDLGRDEAAREGLSEALGLMARNEMYELGPGALAAVAELASAAGRPGLCAALCARLLPLPLTWIETRQHLARLVLKHGSAEPAALDLEDAVGRLAMLPPAPAGAWLDAVEASFTPVTG